MSSFKQISFCVYGSSSKLTKQSYLDASFQLGAEIGKRGFIIFIIVLYVYLIYWVGHICINGGGAHGCMGSLNKGCRSEDGSIIGIRLKKKEETFFSI